MIPERFVRCPVAGRRSGAGTHSLETKSHARKAPWSLFLLVDFNRFLLHVEKRTL